MLLSWQSYELTWAKAFDELEQFGERVEQNVGTHADNGPPTVMHS